MELTWKQYPAYIALAIGFYALFIKLIHTCVFADSNIYALGFVFVLGWFVFDTGLGLAHIVTEFLSDLWHCLFDKED